MNKAEATKTLSDFIEFNKRDISNMTVDYPELGNIFGDLLVAIDKEYASGTINKADLVVAETKASREPQEGDFYRSGNGDVFKLIQPLPNEWRILDLDTGNDKSVDINDVRGWIADGSWELTSDKSNRAVFGFVVGESIEVIDEGKQYPSYTEKINVRSNIDDAKNGEVGKVLGKAASTIFDDSERVVEIQIDNTANRYYISYDGIRSLGLASPKSTQNFGFAIGERVVVMNSGDYYPGCTDKINGTKNTPSPQDGDIGKIVAKSKNNLTSDSVEIILQKNGLRYCIDPIGLKPLAAASTTTTSKPTITANRDAQDLIGYTLVEKSGGKYQFLEVKKGRKYAYSAKLLSLATQNTANWSLGQMTVDTLLGGGTTLGRQYIEELQNGANLPRKAAPTPPPILKGMPDYKNAKNLVGLTLLFTTSGKQFKVNKLKKNNPKNIIYEIQNLANGIIIEHPFPRSIVERLLRAEDNMDVKVLELQAIKAAAQTTTNVSPTQASGTTTNLSDWRSTWKDDGKRASPQRSTKTNGELGMGYDGIVYERVPNVKGVYQWKKTGLNSIAIETMEQFKKEDLQVLLDQLNYALTLFSKGDSEYDETQRQIEGVTKELNKR